MKSLIVYYSFSQHTKTIAEKISQLQGGDLREIIPQLPYNFQSNTTVREIRRGMMRGYCPPLAQGLESIEDYDTLFIGSPNWFNSLAPPVLSFLRKTPLKNKKIFPFFTHGGGGMGSMYEEIKKECGNCKIEKPFVTSGRNDMERILLWLEGAKER